MIRFLLCCILCACLHVSAWADERITDFDVRIDVQTNGDIFVTETLIVNVERRKIKRGIFRDLPRLYTRDGAKLPYQYSVENVRRDGERERYATERDGNSFRIRIGREDYFLPKGPHTFQIQYRVKNQVRYFASHDEIYWNVTGTYWDFPIDKARARLQFPGEAYIQSQSAYTGRQGARNGQYIYDEAGSVYTFETRTPLAAREGLTVSLSFDKGLIDPPSVSDQRTEWWFKNGALTILGFALISIFGYYYRAWNRVGRDPVKPPVFARYMPPQNYSPAAVHYIYHRGLRGNSALIASIIHLATQGWLHMDVIGKTTTLDAKAYPPDSAALTEDDTYLFEELFPRNVKNFTLDGKYSAKFTRLYKHFQTRLKRRYGPDYYRHNARYIMLGMVMSIGAAALAFSQLFTSAGPVFLWALGGLVLLNIVFLWLIPAPTPKGQTIRTEIEGFKLYLETAEKLRLNAVKVGTDHPPPMSKEHYERFLPYAVALGVEKPWTKHFEKSLPRDAETYNPAWTNTMPSRAGSISSLNKALTAGLDSGVSRALPQSSSSSGGGGGGFSGGGGGGGGGGGW